jgi:hypothetical protein
MDHLAEHVLSYLVTHLVSYRVVLACLASVPCTHAIGLCLHLNKLGNSKWRYLLYPFKGGNR